MTQGTKMRRSLSIAALALLPTLALAQTPATLVPRGAVPAPSGLTLVPGDSITVLHNGVATTTLLPSLGAFLSTAAPLASNTVPGLMRGDGTSITVDPATGTASVVGQTPTAASTVPPLANLNVLLADGTYLTGPVLQALLGISTSSTATPTPSTSPTPSPTPTPTATGTTYSFAGAVGLPTGTLALTAIQNTAITGMGLNGSGALLLPSVQYGFAAFESLPAFANGTLVLNVANAPQPLNVAVLLRSDGGTGGGSIFINQGGATVYGTGLSSNPQYSSLPETFTTLQISLVGQVMTVKVDGTQIVTVTATTFPTSGYLGLGSTYDVSPQVQIASMTITPQ